jgi:hypothetical protein
MCGLAAALGALVLAANLLAFRLDERVRAWPTTPGRLLGVDVVYDTVGIWYGRRSNIPMRERRFHVRYSYTVAGVPHVGSQIGAHAATARVNGQRNRYVVGQTVTVHYNAADPGETVLETPFPAVAALGIVLGLVLLFVGWDVYRRHLRPRRGGAFERDA